MVIGGLNKNKITGFIFAVLLAVPFLSFAQGTMQRAGEPVGVTTVTPALAATSSSSVTPRSNPPPPPLPAPAPSPSPTLVPSPAPTPQPVPPPTPRASEGTAPQNANNSNGILYTILAALGVAGLAYGATNFFKQNTKKKKENNKCDSIKKLLDQKIKEMKETTGNWPKEKIENIIKDAAINKFLNEQEKELLKEAEAAKEKYDKLKETIETLQGTYDLCKLELKTGNIKTLKFRGVKAEMILKGEKTSSLRLFDDKDLQAGDSLELVNWDTGKPFAKAEIIEIIEKKLGEIDKSVLIGHEPLDGGVLPSLQKYYGDKINPETPAKIVRFRLVSKE